MGCDIHMFAEVEQRKDWFKDLGELGVDRHYALFYQLAGVRGYGEEHYPLKGLPAEKGWRVSWQWDEDKDDAHSMSFLTFYELKHQEPESYNYKNDTWYLMLEAAAKKHGQRKTRIVFWFDN